MKHYNKSKKTEHLLNIHEVLPESSVNGPGKRYVIWTQGCLKNCSGCCNPDTHDTSNRRLISITDLINDIRVHSRDIEGISISGGEPFLQAEAMFHFLKEIRENMPELSIILFSGYSLEEILHLPYGKKCLHFVDVLIDGEYCISLATHGIPASQNQRLHFFTTRYSVRDFDVVQDTEIIINSIGEIYVSGKPLFISLLTEGA